MVNVGGELAPCGDTTAFEEVAANERVWPLSGCRAACISGPDSFHDPSGDPQGGGLGAQIGGGRSGGSARPGNPRLSVFPARRRSSMALGSCTANATTAALSTILSESDFAAYASDERNGAERSIQRHRRRGEGGDRVLLPLPPLGDPSQERPPTDADQRVCTALTSARVSGYLKSEKIAHGATTSCPCSSRAH